MEDFDVPPYFVCPISLKIMRDPVTVSTGITYDRDSIESWLSDSSKDGKCPVKKLAISDSELTPNHTLRRLIQSWCALNASRGIEQITATPKAPTSKARITEILNEARSPQSLLKCLRRLRSIASQNSTSRWSLEEAGVVDFLARIVISNMVCSTSLPSEDLSDVDGLLGVENPSDEALSVLYNLQLSEAGFKALIGEKNGEFIQSLIHVMRRGSCESRACAVLLLKSMFEVADLMQMITLSQEFFVEVVQLLHDQISPQASKASLNLLIQIIPQGRNRIKAVEAGLVPVLVGFLLNCSSDSKQVDEMSLVLLEMTCQCAEGRAELLKHGAGLAVVSKKILRVSHIGNQRAVRILLSVSKYSTTPAVLQEMLQLGVVAKLCLVLQVDCGNRIKEKAKEILRLHARAWKDSPCIPIDLLSSYPSK